ncbi:hypothetical protein ACWEPC_44820, partial [Nonomuraea sp. NPDC004297]
HPGQAEALAELTLGRDRRAYAELVTVDEILLAPTAGPTPCCTAATWCCASAGPPGRPAARSRRPREPDRRSCRIHGFSPDRMITR